jgi:predicted GH43/DUF377 family glycosyl hydrolase
VLRCSVFIEGWKKTDKDTFVVYYGACDSFVGAAKLEVSFG